MPSRELVIGLGSPHGDDRVGWDVIQALRDLNVQGRSIVIETVHQPWSLLDHFQKQDIAILVDGCVTGRSPGTIIELNIDALKQGNPTQSSSHGSTVHDAIELAKTLGTCPKQVIIFGIEVAAWQPNSTLTPAVRKAIPRAAAQISSLLRTFNPLFRGESR